MAKKYEKGPEAFEPPDECKRCRNLDPVQREFVKEKARLDRIKQEAMRQVYGLLDSEREKAKELLRDSNFVKRALRGIRRATLTQTFDERGNVTRRSSRVYAWIGSYRYIKHYNRDSRLMGYTFFNPVKKLVEHFDTSFHLTSRSIRVSPTHVIHYDQNWKVTGESVLTKVTEFGDNLLGIPPSGQVENYHYEYNENNQREIQKTVTKFYKPELGGLTWSRTI